MIPSFCQKRDQSIISTGSICNHLRMLPIFSFFCVVKHHRWYRSAANRAYYAIFHAMRAVLALDGVDMKHHSGIISEFWKRYIKTGVFDTSLSGLISELSDVRAGSDYNDFFIVSKADTAEQVQSAGTFLTAVETYLRTKY